jgi:diaminohydroxyphosphoribosylaminopyrimidine deaminase/5-amino-6-(5-phosphoribosylamino)uracil reductase
MEQIVMPIQDRLNFVMSTLYQKEVQSILIEGGQFLLQSLIRSHLWDEARILTGNKNFGSGLPAPQIHSLPISHVTIAGDTITTYINKN